MSTQAPSLLHSTKSFLIFILFLVISLEQVNLQDVRSVSGFNVYDINAPSSTFSNCIPGQTFVNGRRVCKNQVIFQDYFTNGLNTSIWSHENHFASEPDYEFVIYDNGRETSYDSSAAALSIKPTIKNEAFSHSMYTVSECTTPKYPQDCTKKGVGWNILPPVISARITTKNSFSFKYGIVEIQARFPEGDWILPQLWLLPKNQDFGKGTTIAGQIRIAQARGNKVLTDNGEDLSNIRLEKGIQFGAGDSIVNVMRHGIGKEPWTNGFHKYELEWTPEKLEFRVDNKFRSALKPPRGGWTNTPELREFLSENPEKPVPDMFPFDQEFYLALGVGVGGIRHFPNTLKWVSEPQKKVLAFWDDREKWSQTWNDNSRLLIKKVKIWSI